MTVVKSWLVAIFAFSGLSHGAQICNLVFDKCPGDFKASTLTVPENVIWLDPVVPVCSENVKVVTGVNSPPPSIVFIIDNSGSMSSSTSGNINSWNDPTEARFRVVSTLLDTIAAASPKAEVGLVIFSRRLQFDHRDNPFFKTAFPNDTSQHDSYVPLTGLNQDFGGGKKGVDTLKALLGYTGRGNLIYATARPGSRPSSNTRLDPTNVRDGTDITLGFDAAKEAMKTAKALKEDQYFIFLSDGEASGVDIPRQDMETDFTKGINTPTTFTVFFKANSTDPTAPPSIQEMTDAIKANGYSASNPKSENFAINLPGSQLLTLIQNNILNPIFANAPGKPESAVMAVGGANYNSTSVDARNFTFPKRVPLSADQTVVKFTYTYSYTDSGKVKQDTVEYPLTVKRSGAAPLGTGLSASCQEQGAITLFNKGSAINLVTADHTDLDVHLTLAAGEACNGCSVEVKPNRNADKENITLTPSGGFELGHFERETSTQIKADGKLQHLPTDSILITYVNPDNPLDVIRKAFPYSDVSTVLTVFAVNDYSRGGEEVEPKPGEHFVLVAPASITLTENGNGTNWSTISSLVGKADTARYVGSVIEASRAFKVDVQVYTNLGQYVNKISFSLSQAEFTRLPKGGKNSTRQIGVLWRGLASDGSKAGTGAYILKTTVTLLKIPGIAEDEASRTDYRIVGVLHVPG